MKYDSKKAKVMDPNDKKCPYCNSENIKEYLYGYPSANYDKEKYVLGGCSNSFDGPKYKCLDCGKDIYIDRQLQLDCLLEDLEKDIKENENNKNESIVIVHSDGIVNYEITLLKDKTKDLSGNYYYTSMIILKRYDYNSVYKIDDVESIENEDFDKYYNKIMQITSNWMNEFDNNELVSDDETREWSLQIDTHDNKLSFTDSKVPTNMQEFKDLIKELEEFFKAQFVINRQKRKNIFNK